MAVLRAGRGRPALPARLRARARAGGRAGLLRAPSSRRRPASRSSSRASAPRRYQRSTDHAARSMLRDATRRCRADRRAGDEALHGDDRRALRRRPVLLLRAERRVNLTGSTSGSTRLDARHGAHRGADSLALVRLTAAPSAGRSAARQRESGLELQHFRHAPRATRAIFRVTLKAGGGTGWPLAS